MAIRTNQNGDPFNEEYLLYTDMNDTMNCLPPIGVVQSWLKSLTNTPALPDGWVECNGQTITDVNSPYNSVTIPDLNSTNRFLRGNTTSGGTGGSEEHLHQVCTGNVTSNSLYDSDGNPTVRSVANDDGAGSFTGYHPQCTDEFYTSKVDTKPPYYEVVWIMRIK